MGNTVWILSEHSKEDAWDHSLILFNEISLNTLAKHIGVRPLSELYDQSILAAEFGHDIEPNYFPADEVEKIVSALITAIREGKSETLHGNVPLVEELEDCLKKVSKARNEGVKVRLALVP